MTDQNHDMRDTAREWRITMIVVGVGFLIAIAVALYFALRPAPAPGAGSPAAPQPAAQTMTPEQRRALTLKVAEVFCDQVIADTKTIGIVPPYAKRAGLPQIGAQRGHYVCTASTGVAKYAIAAEVLCSTILDPRCMSIESVTSDDGTVLYKRPATKPVAK